MCTLTIKRDRQNFLITMNRDERKSRPLEIEPFQWSKPKIFAPQDPLANGTWMGMNEERQVACLLNGYQGESGVAKDKKSRGEIIPFVLSSKNISSAISEINVKSYNSFHLITLTQGGVLHSYWNGTDYQVTKLPEQEWYFFTSSSYDQNKVKEDRQEQFSEWLSKGAVFQNKLPFIHINQDNKNSAFRPLMMRDDACTKSITQFQNSSNDLRARYWGAPHIDLENFYEYNPF